MEFIENKHSGVPVYQLDAGNLFDGYGVPVDIRNRAIVDIMNKMGVFACNVGSGDLKPGLNKFSTATSGAGFTKLSASFVFADTEEFVFMPFLEIGEGEKKILITGLDYTPGTIEIKSGGTRKIKRLKPEEALSRILPSLKQKGLPIILLAHGPRYIIEEMGRQFPEITAALYVFQGESLPANKVFTDLKIIPCGHWGTAVLELRGYFQNDGTVRTESEIHAILPEMPVHPEIEEIVSSALAEEKRVMRKRRLKRVQTGEEIREGSESCAVCHAGQYEAWLSTAHAHSLLSLRKEEREDNECLKCHAAAGTGTGKETRAPEAVECEACHGVGKNHMAKPRLPYGRVSPWRCKVCHDRENSPDFDHDAYMEVIKH